MTTTAQVGDSGIILGQVDTAGVRWLWTGSDPWSPSPAPRAVTGDRATDHGSWDATEFFGPRAYPLEGFARAGDHETLHRAKHRLFGACGIKPFVLRVIEPGFDRQAVFRRDGEALWTEISPTEARFSVPLWAGDPRAYSTAVRTASTGFPSSVGGLTVPIAAPVTIPATVISGQMVLVNDGNTDAYPVFRIDGPVTNPGVVDMESGRAWKLALTLDAGEWVTVDTSTHQVLSMGDVNGSRRYAWSGDWFGLDPGPNTVQFTGATAGAGAQLSASYRSAWI